MTHFKAPDGIEYRSNLKYFRTLEEQGSRSNSVFIKNMQYKHIPGYKEMDLQRMRNLWKKNYEYYNRKNTRSEPKK